MKYLKLASRLFNTPLLVEESYLATFVAAFAGQDPKLEVGTITMSDGSGLSPEQALEGAPIRAQVVGYRIHGGVAVIPVSGALVNKGSYLPTESGMQGYNGILTMFSQALDDPSVESIVLDIDSPGGEVAGCFDLCRLVAASRDEKPIVAFVGEQATSAAYAIASAAETIYVPQTGMVGSIGVLVAHQDFSKKLSKVGIKVTLIHSGEHKVDGNPFEALPSTVKENIQDRIDSTRQMFAELVAENRSMSVESVLATEAQTYEGATAVDIGLADEIMSFNEVIETMSKNKDAGNVSLDAQATMKNEDSEPLLEDTQPTEEAKEAAPETKELAVEEGNVEAVLFDALAVTELCEKAEAGHLVATFIKDQATSEQVEKSLAQLTELRGKLVAAEMTPEQVARVEAHFDSPANLAAAVIAESKAEDAEIRGTITSRGEGQSETKKGVNFYDFQQTS